MHVLPFVMLLNSSARSTHTFDFSLLVAGCSDWLTGLGGSDADVMTSSGLLSTVYIDDECAADDVTDL